MCRASTRVERRARHRLVGCQLLHLLTGIVGTTSHRTPYRRSVASGSMTVLGTRATVQASAGPRVAALLEGPLRPLTVVHRGRDAVYVGPRRLVRRRRRRPVDARALRARRAGSPAARHGHGRHDRRRRARAGRGGDGAGRPAGLHNCPETARATGFRGAVSTHLCGNRGHRARHPHLPHRHAPRGPDRPWRRADPARRRRAVRLAGRRTSDRRLGAPTSTRCPSALHRTTLLSATLLDCALHGEVLPEFARWYVALHSAHSPTTGGTASPTPPSRWPTSATPPGAGLLLGARPPCALQEAA